MGRPTTSEHMNRVVLYLPEWVVYEMDAESLEEGVSRSEIARRWMTLPARTRKRQT